MRMFFVFMIHDYVKSLSKTNFEKETYYSYFHHSYLKDKINVKSSLRPNNSNS